MQNLWHYIVPLFFLGIWALTSLFNRDAQPLPQRAGRTPGPRPGGPIPTTRPVERLPESFDRSGGDPWPGRPAPPRPEPRRVPGKGQDEIVILENRARRPEAERRPERAGGSSRRANRSKGAPAPTSAGGAKRERGRTLSQSMGQENAEQLGRPLEKNPLAGVTSTLASPPPSDLASPIGAPSTANRSVSAFQPDLRSLVRSPDRLVDSLILSEILQPPLSIRRQRRPRG